MKAGLKRDRCLGPIDATRGARIGSDHGSIPRHVSAFTLIEVMVVVAIMGIILAMGLPSFLRMMRQEGMRKAVNGVVKACDDARAHAVLGGTTTTLVFRPRARRLAGDSPDVLPDDISIEMLDINLLEYNESEVAMVRFFPNGTSDEMTIVFRSSKNEWKKISLEITTGLTTVQDVR